jgi:membrane associated rhomboid family serine protease
MAAALDLVEIVLKECARIAPAPLYPVDFLNATGLPRPLLDPVLDQLRLGGLLRLTEWTPAKGQGYTITEDGIRVLTTPRLLDRLRREGVAPQAAEPPLKAAAASGEPNTYERGEAVRRALLESKRPIVSQVLLFANIAVFLAGIVVAQFQQVPINEFVMGRGSRDVIRVVHDTGAIRKTDVYLYEQWWRLLSCCFVHFGLIHLGVNMYTLFVIGPLLERLWGHGRYLVLYAVAGLAGSCAIVAFSHGTGAGASGALWGVMASLATWIYLNRHHLPPELAAAWYRQLGIVLLLNVLITFTIPNISAAAHFGGGIAGLAVGVPLHFSRFGRNPLQRSSAALATLVVPLVALGLVLLRAPDPVELSRLGWSEVLDNVRPAQEQVDKIMQQPSAFWKDDDLCRTALAQMNRTQHVLKIVEPVLAEVDREHYPDQAPAVEQARACVNGWLAYFSRMQELVERRQEIPQATQVELTIQRVSLIGMTNHVTKSGL